ncbi:MAG: hypothetical protein GY710_26490 [Desulfobacteraceae bacterium]|nr:hypothetical protein [Desulfobacteraceae bacterium]
MPKLKNLVRLITFCQSIEGDSTPPVIETIKIPMGKKPPAHRLICLYGKPLNALSRIRKNAIKENKKIYRVEIDVARGESIKGNTTLDNVGTTQIMVLERLDAKLNKAVTAILLQDGDNFEFENPNYIIGQDPDRLNLIWNDPRFSHLSIIVWSAPISKEKPSYEKRAALKSLDLIVKKYILNYVGDPEKVKFLI